MGYGVNEKDALNDRPLIIHASKILSGINTALRKAGGNDHNLNADAPKEKKESSSASGLEEDRRSFNKNIYPK
jgi:hypothetical protein